MADKVNPNNDEARRIASELAKKQAAQRIQELEAIDPDQRAKQHQFRTLMQTPDEDDNGPQPIAPTGPSPFQTNFTSSNAKNSGIDPKLAMPSPSYSPTPNINNMPQDSFSILPEDPLSDEGLPQSPGYYASTDLPWQSLNSPDFQEDASSAVQIPGQTTNQSIQTGETNRPKALDSANGKARRDPLSDSLNRGPASLPQKEKALDANPFGVAGKPMAAKSFHAEMAAKKQDSKDANKENSQPTARFWNEEKNQNSATSLPQNQQGIDRKISATTGNLDARIENKKAQAKPFDPIAESGKDQPAQEENKSKGRESKKESSDNAGPNQTNLVAPQFQGTADASAVAPAPYANPQLAQLFCQTVGTIILTKMPSGISKTEFVLNNPRFANSRFAGATIEVTRYSTAPDALNIRISGSPEAVNAFNQSKDSLMATFQNGYDAGNFKFQITRIDVDQASSKPVFHRREKGQDQGSSDQEGRPQ